MSKTKSPAAPQAEDAEALPGSRIVRLQGGGLRFLDAHEISQNDFNVVTRPFQSNTTQQWRLTNVGGNVHTLVQVSSGRFLDAHEVASQGFRVVTRPQQNNDTQRWRIVEFGGGFVTVQHVSSGRFLEATLDGDFQVVIRPGPANDQQTWRLGSP